MDMIQYITNKTSDDDDIEFVEDTILCVLSESRRALDAKPNCLLIFTYYLFVLIYVASMLLIFY